MGGLVTREQAAAFVSNYGQTWERWDIDGFVELFSEDVVYVAHATDETVVGRPALSAYVEKEKSEQGAVRVRMGVPVIDADRVVAEFWVNSREEPATTVAGCLIARLAPPGICDRFREYWFDIEGDIEAFAGWGE
jgi:ketosteroid isomerase-like protein